MRYGLEYSREAIRYLDKLAGPTRTRVLLKISQIRDEPGSTSKPLRGRRAALRSARVGGLRIIFEVDDERSVVFVARIGPRGQVYRGLE